MTGSGGAGRGDEPADHNRDPHERGDDPARHEDPARHDGDPAGELPASIRVAAGSLRMVAPEPTSGK